LLSADSTTTGSRPLAQDELARPVEAVDVADLGEQVKGQDRADPEDRLECLAAAIAAGEAAQLALEQLQLLLESTHDREHHLDLRAGARVELEPVDPAASLDGQEPAARTRPTLMGQQRMEALRPAGALGSEIDPINVQTDQLAKDYGLKEARKERRAGPPAQLSSTVTSAATATAAGSSASASASSTSSESSRSSSSPWCPDVLIASSYIVTSFGQATTK